MRLVGPRTAEDGDEAAGFLAGAPAAVAQVRRWIRAATSPYRQALGAELEDIEQETLLSLTETLRAGTFEGRSLLATYVRRAALYRCINRVRDRRRRTTVPLAEDAHVAREAGPERLAVARDEAMTALRVMAQLGEGCRELWRLLQQGIAYRDMSDRLGVAAGTLRVRVLRCRQKALEEWERLTGAAR